MAVDEALHLRPAMAKQLLCTVLMLLVPGFAQPNPLRNLLSRQLHEESDATGSGVSTWGSKTYSTTAPSQYSTPPNISKPHPPPSQIPWELELAPFMNATFSPRDPNSTRLVGPPRLAGVFKGKIGAGLLITKTVLSGNIAITMQGFVKGDRLLVVPNAAEAFLDRGTGAGEWLRGFPGLWGLAARITLPRALQYVSSNKKVDFDLCKAEQDMLVFGLGVCVQVAICQLLLFHPPGMRQPREGLWRRGFGGYRGSNQEPN